MRQARNYGLDIVALTDHDTTSGWAEAREACDELGMTFVPGIEMSTKAGGESGTGGTFTSAATPTDAITPSRSTSVPPSITCPGATTILAPVIAWTRGLASRRPSVGTVDTCALTPNPPKATMIGRPTRSFQLRQSSVRPI